MLVKMDHTKKFVFVDPRFVRPSMLDKALSGLDTDISNILKSEEPDEIKVRNYMTALSRYKSFSTSPPPTVHPPTLPPPPPPPPTIAAVPVSVPPVIQFKVTSPSKRSGKRIKIEPLEGASSIDSQPWSRTQRKRIKKKFGPQWIEYNETLRNKKSRPPWIEQ